MSASSASSSSSTAFAWLDAGLRFVAGLGRDDVSSYAEARRRYPSEDAARQAYRRGVLALMAPNTWGALSGVENADFQHVDAGGVRIQGRTRAQVGDHVRIVLPVAGVERHDWVQVVGALETADRSFIQVRPSADPTLRPPTPGVIAHFFGPEALNTFMLTCAGTELVAHVVGEHERANTGDAAGDTGSALRNRLAAELGWGLRDALQPAGAQQHQWNRFTANLVGNGFQA